MDPIALHQNGTKQCPLFHKCNGKGNSKNPSGLKHFVVDSCPLVDSIGSEKLLENKLKKLVLEKNELNKLNNQQSEQIFKIEQELIALRNKEVFQESHKSLEPRIKELENIVEKFKFDRENIIEEKNKLEEKVKILESESSSLAKYTFFINLNIKIVLFKTLCLVLVKLSKI